MANKGKKLYLGRQVIYTDRDGDQSGAFVAHIHSDDRCDLQVLRTLGDGSRV